MPGIKDWAEDDRPREKLIAKGADALSNSELLAILINNGTIDSSAVDLAKELLAKCNNDLKHLSLLSYKEMVQLKVKGLGEAKAISIAAALELGLRRNVAENQVDTIKKSKDIALFMQAQLAYKSHEVFVVIYLNTACKILHHCIISEGGIKGIHVDTKIILKKALAYNATQLILCHNHPSGAVKPSQQDKELTQKIQQAAMLLDIQVIDHIIVSSETYFSFADKGMM
ncbi:RadC family protein [Parasediminibacterium sp. JCM 36343]|uniref:RadC family protein n=1 Tax=Parasediminibacterium sp. JCM 36343 TaxID=3374279 RepID=UPI00397E156A